MVNNLSSTPFKVNKQLLDYLNIYGEDHEILLSNDDIIKLESIEKKTTYILNKLNSLKSEYLLQENILSIASIFNSVNIYFPVRLDQRIKEVDYIAYLIILIIKVMNWLRHYCYLLYLVL